MLRVTVRALARKAPNKVGSKAAAAVGSAPVPSISSIRAVPPVGESKVSIPPIPGVRSIRAMRRQERAAAAAHANLVSQQPKKLPARNHAKTTKIVKPAKPVKVTKASSAIQKAANESRVKVTAQHKVKKVVQGSKAKPKKIVKSLTAKKAHK